MFALTAPHTRGGKLTSNFPLRAHMCSSQYPQKYSVAKWNSGKKNSWNYYIIILYKLQYMYELEGTISVVDQNPDLFGSASFCRIRNRIGIGIRGKPIRIRSIRIGINSNHILDRHQMEIRIDPDRHQSDANPQNFVQLYFMVWKEPKRFSNEENHRTKMVYGK